MPEPTLRNAIEYDERDVGTLTWAAARHLAFALLAITDAITDKAEVELDEQMAQHAHVSARWLGEMGQEQRSN